MNPDASIQHKPGFKADADGVAFVEEGERVPFVEFDFGAVEAEVDRRDREGVAAYHRDKLTELVRFTCYALLSGNPSAELAGRRAYFFALALRQPPFESQHELAEHLDLDKGTISKQFNFFLSQNPLLARECHRDDLE